MRNASDFYNFDPYVDTDGPYSDDLDAEQADERAAEDAALATLVFPHEGAIDAERPSYCRCDGGGIIIGSGIGAGYEHCPCVEDND